jgi:hypothetical protein
MMKTALPITCTLLALVPLVTTAAPGEKVPVDRIATDLYPTEYDPPQLPEAAKRGVDGNVVSAQMVAPANPTAFDVRNIGLTWEVEALKRSDGSIMLNGSVEETQFEGFINYGSAINGILAGDSGNELVTLTENRILQPVFVSSRVPTTFSVPTDKLVALTGIAPQPQKQIDAVLENGAKIDRAGAQPKPEVAKPHVYVIEVGRVGKPE